jgi:hypothetical protein
MITDGKFAEDFIPRFQNKPIQRESPLAITADYDKFLDDLLKEMGLAHGYNVFKEKHAYNSHVIFTIESKIKNSLLDRIINEDLRGQLFSVYEVAMFIEEPWFGRKFGCSPIDDQRAEIEIIDTKYIPEVFEVRRQIVEYSKLIEDSQFPFLSSALQIHPIEKDRILSIK